MAYDAERGLLFIHIPKTGGKSVAAALGLIPEAHLERWKWRSVPNRAATWAQRRTADSSARGRLYGLIDHAFAAQHLTYAEIYLLGLIESNALADATKFTVCRNPFDRAVSAFFHMSRSDERSPSEFLRFLHRWATETPTDHGQLAIRRAQREFCVDLRGRNVLDTVLRFESLESDVQSFARRHLGSNVAVPSLGRQRTSIGYREFYTSEARRLVEELYKEDLETFGYEY